MSKRRGAIGTNYSNFVLGVNQAMATFGTEAAIRDEYTRFRDLLNKRIGRAVSSGMYLGDTALGQYKEYVRPATNRQGNVIPGKWKGDLPKLSDFKTIGEIVNFLGRMQRSTFRPTGSLSGIREVRTQQQQEFDRFLQGYAGVQNYSNADLSAIGAAMDYARALGLENIHYVIAATSRAGASKKSKEQILKEALLSMRERANSPVQKGAITRFINASQSGNEKATQDAIARLNNALRKYGTP